MQISKSRHVCALRLSNSTNKKLVRLYCGIQIEKSGTRPVVRSTVLPTWQLRSFIPSGPTHFLDHGREGPAIVPIAQYLLTSQFSHQCRCRTVRHEPTQCPSDAGRVSRIAAQS